MAFGGQLLRSRISSQRLVLVAAFVTILIATTVLTGLAVYLRAATTAAVQETLAAQPSTETGVTLDTTVTDADGLKSVDEAVRAGFDATFAAVPHETTLRLETDTTYTLPLTSPDGIDTLTTFVWREDLRDHATLVSGTWPEPGAAGEPVDVVVSEGAAGLLGVQVGSTIDVIQRLDSIPVHVVVTGIYRPVAPADAFWRSDTLDTLGTRSGTNFPLVGPLLVADEQTLGGAVSTRGIAGSWRLGATWTDASLAAVDLTRARLANFTNGSNDESLAQDGANVRIESGLSSLLPSLQRSLTANQSMMIIPILQLALLAAYTLVLAARLLAEHRRDESALLQARGASTRQSVALVVRETGALVLPAALVAPLLAWGLLALVAGHGPFAPLADRVPLPGLYWWTISIAAAALCGLALVLPSLRRGRSYIETQAERGRQDRRAVLQRAGADVLLAGAALLAYYQLRHYQSPVITGSSGASVDPLLVLGPCLALFAAAALALRLLPRIAQVAQAASARGSRLSAALGAWQVSRRPLRYSGPALLLVLALAIGALSTAHAASWLRSQDDQATFAAGSDVRVSAATSYGAMPVAGQAAALAALPGSPAVMAAYQATATLGDTPVNVLGLDMSLVPSVVHARPDLVPTGLTSLVKPLVDARPDVHGVELTAAVQKLTMKVTGKSGDGSLPQVDPVGSVRLTIQDATGAVYFAPVLPIQFDGVSRDIDVKLAALAGVSAADAGSQIAGSAEGAALTFPIEIIGALVALPNAVVAIDTPQGPSESPGTSTLTIDSLTADGAAVTLPADPVWAVQLAGAPTGATPSVTTNPSVLSVNSLTPFGAPPISLRVTALAPTTALPVILDTTAANAAGAKVGDRISVRAGAADIAGTVTGTIEAFPGTDPARGVILMDLAALADSRWTDAGASTLPSGWWLATNEPAATTTALDQRPGLATDVISQTALAKALRHDPLGLATLGALFAGFVAALGFAGVGFIVNLIIGARERLAEFAVLRALGVSRRQVLALLLVEQGFLVGLGVVVGISVGIAVAFLVVPYVVLSAQALRTLPPVLVEVPWLGIAALAASTVLLLALAVAVAARRLQQHGLGGSLRLGEDR